MGINTKTVTEHPNEHDMIPQGLWWKQNIFINEATDVGDAFAKLRSIFASLNRASAIRFRLKFKIIFFHIFH